jgi:hypothetical protein
LINVTQSVKNVTDAVEARRQTMADALRKIVAKEVHRKQFERAEEDLVAVLEVFFREQRRSVAEALRELGEVGNADQIMELVYNPRDWDDVLVDAVFPHLLKSGGEAAVAQFRLMGVDVRVERFVEVPMEKATTASEWLANHLDDAGDLAAETWSTVAGDVSLGFATEWPLWMRHEIVGHLADAFQQDYWQQINATTQANLRDLIERGLLDGKSIRDIASSLVGDGLDEFYHGRARNIARTESANALNGARKASMNRLATEVPQFQSVIQQTWLSVLGDTTRADHANLDGVPADGDGLWLLGGVRVPWPGHYSLPVEQRASCQCTIQHAFGMNEQEAQGLIDEFNERHAAGVEEKAKDRDVQEKTRSDRLILSRMIGNVIHEKLNEVQLVVPPGAIDLSVNVDVSGLPAPKIDVHVPQQPAPIVHVEQPSVVVEAPNVTVEAARAPIVNMDPVINVAAPEAPNVAVEVQPPNIVVEGPDVVVAAPNVEAPVITVEAAKAPDVTVEAPVITVEAAKAPDVTVEGAEPPRRAVIKHADGTMSQITLE